MNHISKKITQKINCQGLLEPFFASPPSTNFCLWKSRFLTSCTLTEGSRLVLLVVFSLEVKDVILFESLLTEIVNDCGIEH